MANKAQVMKCHTQALWICTCAEDSVLMALCLHVQQTVQCEASHSDSILSSVLASRWSIPGRSLLPCFIVALKNHSMSRGNDCAMSCVFVSNPYPTMTLYKSNISITPKTMLWFNSTSSSVCLSSLQLSAAS